MRSLLSIVGLTMALSVLLTPSASAATADTAATAAPDQAAAIGSSSVLWGAKIKGAPFDTRQIDAFESRVGKQMSIISWGQPWYNHGQFQAFQTSAFDAARKQGLLPLLTWGSWDLANKSTHSPNFQLADIIAGKYDKQITQWARAAKAWGHPFFLRFDWEMNGAWFPWSERVNGNHPGEYLRMWRHVPDIFTRVGAHNATWVWCPNIVGRTSTPLTKLYPGDRYVDWTCFDAYNWGTTKGPWQTFSQLMTGSALVTGGHDTYHELLSIAGSKPMMIAETASVENGGNKAAWIKDMLSRLPTQYPKVKAFIWNNIAEAGGTTWPLESSRASLAAFKAGIASSRYATNHFGATTTGKVPIPR
jgi:beta-mannanase